VKNIVTTIVLISIFSTIFAQQNKEDSIFLQNGKIYSGKIVKFSPKESITIQTKTEIQNIWWQDIEKYVINNSNANDIAKILGNDNLNQNSSKSDSSSFKSHKGFVSIYAGIGTKVIKFQFFKDFKLSSHLAIGIGTGYKRVSENDFLPLLSDFKIFSNDNKSLISISIAGGYGFCIVDGIKSGGIVFNPSISNGFKLKGNEFLTIGVDFDLQNGYFIPQNYYSPDAYGNFIKESRFIRGNLISVGVIIGLTI